MSGGAYNHIYIQVEEVAMQLLRHPESYRKAFGRHLLEVATALHDLEYVDSADMSPGDDKEAIMNCISKSDLGKSIIMEAEKVLEELQGWILGAKGEN